MTTQARQGKEVLKRACSLVRRSGRPTYVSKNATMVRKVTSPKPQDRLAQTTPAIKKASVIKQRVLKVGKRYINHVPNRRRMCTLLGFLTEKAKRS